MNTYTLVSLSPDDMPRAVLGHVTQEVVSRAIHRQIDACMDQAPEKIREAGKRCNPEAINTTINACVANSLAELAKGQFVFVGRRKDGFEHLLGTTDRILMIASEEHHPELLPLTQAAISALSALGDVDNTKYTSMLEGLQHVN